MRQGYTQEEESLKTKLLQITYEGMDGDTYINLQKRMSGNNVSYNPTALT